MAKRKEINVNCSFESFEPKINNRNGELTHFSTGSIVIKSKNLIGVYEQQIDTNPHPPIYDLHLQESLRGSSKNKRPKKFKSKIINNLNHQKIY